MHYTFLSASQAIVKQYSRAATGALIKQPYPFIYEVTSHRATCTTLPALFTEMQAHADKGHCLLKGELLRPLVSESRAGTTDASTPTSWICLDLDGVSGFGTTDDFLAAISCVGVDHIVQWSSGMGIDDTKGLRCHIFMLLDQPAHPQLLKQWLTHLNLSIPELSTQMQLTKTGNALRWPLDITTCQNDKLLYIAPPKLGKGIKDPFTKNARITLNTRTRKTFTLPALIPNKSTLAELADKRVNELRIAAGMPKRRKVRSKFLGQIEYMPNPDAASITETKTERGFVYLNLNGGDSWGYYHPEDNATFIFNFKGEPTYRTEDLLPEYWASLQQQAQSYQPNSQGMVYLAFRDFKSASYYNGVFNAETNDLTLAVAKNETQLRHFMTQRGQTMGAFVPDWDIVWEPNNPLIVDAPNQRLNIFKSSALMSAPPQGKHITQVPKTIKRVIQHALNDSKDTYTHFLNWVACILQFRTMTGTAWVLHGDEGTGKGVIYNHILTPLLGPDNVVAKKMKELESEFTGYLENKLFVFIDEVEAGKRFYEANIDATLRNLITEPVISVRKMYQMAYMAPNHSNMLFASNKPEPVNIPPGDRRFNVGYYQPEKLTIDDADILAISSELPDFYSFLYHYPADRQQARKPIKNEAKAQLASVGRSSIDTVADAILQGDLSFFWDHLPANKNSPLDGFNNIKLLNYRTLLVELITKRETKLTRDDLFTLFEWCIGGMPSSPNKFTSLLKHHRIHLTQVWKHARNVRGLSTEWKIDPTWHKNALKEIEEKKV